LEADEVKQRTPKLFDGYVTPDRVLIRPEALRRYCNGFGPADIAQRLHQRGMLIPDENGKKLARTESVMGKTGRFYVLKLDPRE
jgi:hypothetical protein